MDNVPKNETKYYQELQSFINNSKSEPWKMIMTFPKYIDRQHLSVFLARYEIFKKIINIHGSIVECGVWNGNGLMTWAQCCAIMEPYNYIRKIIGFDTFEGLPGFCDKDKAGDRGHQLDVGQFKMDNYKELMQAIELYDQNRPIGHIQKVELVKGDATETIPQYVKQNPHLIVSLLNLDFDLYEPTKVALEYLVPRMPKGGVIVFDELSQARCPGETVAMIEQIGISNIKLERLSFEPAISYALIK